MDRNLTEISKELNRQSGFESMPGLIFITDQSAQPCPEEIITKMPSGSMVILRDYDVENRAELGRALAYVCKARNIKFIVAGDFALSLMLEADGIHFAEFKMSEAELIRKEKPDYFITAAVHNEEAIKNAIRLDIDALLLAPIFATKSHPETFDDQDKVVGPEQLKKMCHKYRIPIYALGGINSETIMKIKDTGAAGIAAIRGL